MNKYYFAQIYKSYDSDLGYLQLFIHYSAPELGPVILDVLSLLEVGAEQLTQVLQNEGEALPRLEWALELFDLVLFDESVFINKYSNYQHYQSMPSQWCEELTPDQDVYKSLELFTSTLYLS